MEMHLSDAGQGGILKVSLAGRLDAPGVNHIESQLAAHLVPCGAHAIVDLSEVTFVGSGGIRMFITIGREIGKLGGKLALYGAQPLVAQIFETCYLNQIVPVRPDAGAAIAAVRR